MSGPPPAFVAPPSSLALTAGVAAPLGLTLADDSAVALGLLGEAPESLTVTLIASAGILLLDPSAFVGIEVVGDATGAIILSATSADLAGLNAALAAVELDAPSGGSLDYIARQTSGPLPATVTSSSLTYSASGSFTATTAAIGTDATIAGDSFAETLALAANVTAAITGAVDVGSASLAASSTVAILGGTFTAGGVVLGSGAVLIDFGTVTLDGLDETGAALLPEGAALDGPVVLQTGGLIDFAGVLQADSMAAAAGLVAVSLVAGAIIEGAGTLIAGNFSESELIAGPGTILALGPAPLTVSAGEIGGGAHLDIAPGAVLELGPIPPLFGVFDPTPVTVDASVTIAFAPGASDARDDGPYASAIGEQGGVLVLDDPGDFSGTIAGFAPGDRIVLGTLASLSIFDVTATGFDVSGLDSSGKTEIVTIHASLAGSSRPAVETDAAGTQVIGLRPSGVTLAVNGTPATGAEIDAVSGFATPIEGLGLIVPADGSIGLVLTVAPVDGLIAESGGSTAASLTLSAATALALNADLAALAYTPRGNGSGDVLRFTGGAGLAGFTAAIGVAIAAPATLAFDGASGAGFGAATAWTGGIAPANGDTAVLPAHAGAPVILTGPGVAGALSVVGGYDLAGGFDLPGLAEASDLAGSAGTALDVGSGGFALFDADAVVTLGGGVNVGDATGAGTLGVAGTLLAPGQTVSVGGASAGSSRFEVTGTVAGGDLVIGADAPAIADIAGGIGFSATTLGAFGTLNATGTVSPGLGVIGLGVIGLGALDIVAGTLGLAGGVRASAASATLAGGAITLADQASFAVSQNFDLSVGTVSIWQEASLAAGSITIGAGAMLAGAGAIDASVIVSGTLEAEAGALVLNGDLTGGAIIAAGAALTLAGSASGGTISFAGADALLTLDDPAAMHDAVANFATGDAIDLIGVAPSLVSVANGTVSIADPGSFALSTAQGQPAPVVSGDGHDGSLITSGGAMPCFARGTRLLTPDGYRPVETLRPGDGLIALGGAIRRIAWIGWRCLDLATDPDVDLLRPVTIAPGAFGPGRPRRALAISPLHAVFAADALVPAVLLVNGATIVRDASGFAVTYYHVELDRHEIVLAEGLPVETYRDNGNRARFAGALGTPGGYLPPCAGLVSGGARLCDIRTALHRRALALGHRIVHDPGFAAVTGSEVVASRRFGSRMILDLPRPAAGVVLRTACAVPAETDPASEDRRRLGVCLGRVRADGRLAVAEPGAGWHDRASGDRGRWSMAEAELFLPRPAQRISVEILGSVPRWRRGPARPAI